MERYYVILAEDNNTVWKVLGFGLKRSAQAAAIQWADSAFVVVVVSGDCMKYSDNDIVKRARKKINLEAEA